MSWKEEDHQKQPIEYFSGIYNHCCAAAHSPSLMPAPGAEIGYWVSLLIAGGLGELLVSPQPLSPSLLLSCTALPAVDPAVLQALGGNHVLPGGIQHCLPVTLLIGPQSPTQDHLLRMALKILEMGIGPFCTPANCLFYPRDTIPFLCHYCSSFPRAPGLSLQGGLCPP